VVVTILASLIIAAEANALAVSISAKFAVSLGMVVGPIPCWNVRYFVSQSRLLYDKINDNFSNLHQNLPFSHVYYKSVVALIIHLIWRTDEEANGIDYVLSSYP
jgi:hypothetical protein